MKTTKYPRKTKYNNQESKEGCKQCAGKHTTTEAHASETKHSNCKKRILGESKKARKPNARTWETNKAREQAIRWQKNRCKRERKKHARRQSASMFVNEKGR